MKAKRSSYFLKKRRKLPYPMPLTSFADYSSVIIFLSSSLWHFTTFMARKADGVFVMYDVTSETSFKNVRNWMVSVQVSNRRYMWFLYQFVCVHIEGTWVQFASVFSLNGVLTATCLHKSELLSTCTYMHFRKVLKTVRYLPSSATSWI